MEIKKNEEENSENEGENNIAVSDSSYLLKSVFEDRPAVIFFQYDSSMLQKKTCRSYEIDWRDNINKKFSIYYKSYKNEPDCIIIPTKINGVKRTKNFFQGNLIWKLMSIEKMSLLIKKLNKYQRYNHFPLTWEIGRKDNLYKNFSKMKEKFPEDYKFCPETFILPEDNDSFRSKIKDDPSSLWIIKPVASSRGRGIRLMSNPDNVPKRCLISNYISNPHLINNKKYDLRLYVVITSFTPLKVYLYDEGLIRFCCEDYNLSKETTHNRFVHLTNYSVNKNSENFDSNVSDKDDFQGSKWSLTALKKFFLQNNMNFDLLLIKIKDIVVKSVISITDESIKVIKKLTKNNNSLFELYGYDILIDSDFNPWLMEINLNPSLNVDTKLDFKIKSMLMSDIFTLIGIIPYKHTNQEKQLINYLDSNKPKNHRIKKYNCASKNYIENVEHDEDLDESCINENALTLFEYRMKDKKKMIESIDEEIYNNDDVPNLINSLDIKGK